MPELGDAPAPIDTGPGSEATGGEALPSWQQAMADAIAETGAEDVPEGEEGETVEGDAIEAKEGDGEKAKDEPPAKPEKKPEAKKDEEKPKEEPSKLFAAIARERNKVKEREAKVAAREQELEGVTKKAKTFDDVVRRLHEDPHGLLMEAGGDELITKLLDQTAEREKSPAEQEVAKLRRDLQERDARAKQQSEREMIARHRQAVADEVMKAGETFDLVNSLGEHDAVYQVIVGYHAKYGHVMPVADAAEIVEKGLTERLSKSKKFGAREAVKPPLASTGKPPPKRSNTTLSSVAVGEVPAADDDGPLDPRAREKWALGLAAAG